ncbi:MAG: hypothetical protein HY429_01860 [Candidatus Levybacteria bacterium]|nr:hypothetical protein [Candidatus Levybacteria bacterium]
MKISNFKFSISNTLAPLSIIAFAVLLRLLPHPPNVAPIAAMALFGGCYLNKKYALAVPLFSMVVSDYFLGFHNTMLFVYGSFILTGLVGMWVKTHRSVPIIISAALFSSLLFFIITNFGVWLVTNMYPKTIDGLLQSYTMAIPFFRNTIFGDLLYTGLFFGSFAFIKNLLSLYRLKLVQSKAPKSV